MSSEQTRYVDYIKFSHTLSNANRRFVDGFRQIAHIGGFHCEIDSESLVAKPINQMSSVEEALSDLEPHLRAWELRSELLRKCPFRFKRSGDVVRDERGGQVVKVGVIEEVNIANEVTHILTSSRLEIPKGPPLVVGEEIKRLSARWREVVQGEERQRSQC